MNRMARCWVGLLVAAPLGLLGCERSEQPPYAIPAGVSVDPPRRAPETGSMTLPGQEPSAPLPAGAEVPMVTDTVAVPTTRPEDTPAVLPEAPQQPAPPSD